MKITNVISKARPVVIHAPGFTSSKVLTNEKTYHHNNPLWKYIYACYIRSKPEKIGQEAMRGLTIITWNNGSAKGVLEECLDRSGIPYTVLGKGIDDWKNICKIRLTCEALSKIKTKYVIGLDAFDILLLASPAEILKRFKQFKCEMVFNAGLRFYPLCHRYESPGDNFITKDWQMFQDKISKSNFKYLNGGAWIGKTAFCRDFFRDCLNQNTAELIANKKLPGDKEKGLFHQEASESEQVILHMVFRNHFPKVQLDYDCEIFLNLSKLPANGKYIRLYRSFFEVPFKEWFELFKYSPSKQSDIQNFGRLALNRFYEFLFWISDKLKRRFGWYRDFVAYIKSRQ